MKYKFEVIFDTDIMPIINEKDAKNYMGLLMNHLFKFYKIPEYKYIGEEN